MSRRLFGALLAVALLATVLVAGGPARPAAAAVRRPRAAPGVVSYTSPVDAPVVDPFRPPTTPYGPGNRGLEYGTDAGAVVRAAADGRVTFAGSVAGTLHVTVLHGDGLRTTVSYLATVDVVVGQQVHQGDRLGTTAGKLLFTARSGDAYLDPASLLEAGPPHVRLVPFDVPPGSGAGGERSAIRQLLGGLVGGLGAVGSALRGAGGAAAGAAGGLSADALGWLQSHPQLLLAISELVVGSTAAPFAAVAVLLAPMAAQAIRSAWEISRRACTRAGETVARPVGRRIAVLVAGLGSDTHHGAVSDVRVGELGYRSPDVVRFSYAGGHTPRTGAAVPSAPTTTYERKDTGQDLRVVGRRLADLVEAVAHDQPGLPIDLIAHSQGGLVMRLALIELEARHGRAWLDRLGLVASLATPYDGADLGTDAAILRSIPVAGPLALGAILRSWAPGLGPGAASLAQLSTTSSLIRFLHDHPIAPGLHAISIAARGDLVVPVPRAHLEGAPEAVVPVTGLGAHDQLPGSAAATRELALALAGKPPTCKSLPEALGDQLAGLWRSGADQLLGMEVLHAASSG